MKFQNSALSSDSGGMPRLSSIPYLVLCFGAAFCLWHYSQDQFRRDFSFVLSNHIDQARGRLLFYDGVVVEGRQMPAPLSGILYPNQPDWMTVRKQADIFNGTLDARLLVHPQPAFAHEIHFESLPPASHLRLLYGFSDAARESAPPDGLGVEISAVDAQQRVLHRQVVAWTHGQPWQAGLQSVEIPLPESPVESHLSKSLTISVRLTSPFNWNHLFYVDGYLW